jgi:hypothetical protein
VWSIYKRGNLYVDIILSHHDIKIYLAACEIPAPLQQKSKHKNPAVLRASIVSLCPLLCLNNMCTELIAFELVAKF